MEPYLLGRSSGSVVYNRDRVVGFLLDCNKLSSLCRVLGAMVV